jgi:hypothetical protein
MQDDWNSTSKKDLAIFAKNFGSSKKSRTFAPNSTRLASH